MKSASVSTPASLDSDKGGIFFSAHAYSVSTID
jgi:hypothetical protein